FQEIFGVAATPTQQQMLHIEAAQILTRNGELQRMAIEAGIDPDAGVDGVPPSVQKRFLEALAESNSASGALKSAIHSAGVSVRGGGRGEHPQRTHPALVNAFAPTAAENPSVATPLRRSLRVYAFDPILGTRVDTESINQTTLEVRWEPDLKPGPVGEYIEVV